MPYAAAYEEQQRRLAGVVAARESSPRIGDLLLVEHDPVITVTKRGAGAGHVLHPAEWLRARGIAVEATDRGGDVTYHGPGQVVAYPIVDLNRLGIRIHEYLRMLERVVIEVLGSFGIEGVRDESATGVWVERESGFGGGPAKVCAMGVRVRRWVTMHGLALNVDPEMGHFGLIVPCGLAGRPVTSLRELLGDSAPGTDEVKAALAVGLASACGSLAVSADAARASAG